MKIDRFLVQNYMGYSAQEFELHPHFNLFAGENGAGKTSVLEALADALGIWHSVVKDYGTRNIRKDHVRRAWVGTNGTHTLERQYPVVVSVSEGRIGDVTHSWKRGFYGTTKPDRDSGTSKVRRAIQERVASVRTGETVILPLLGYYGDGRLHLDRQVRAKRSGKENPRRLKNSLSRLEGNRNSLDSRIAWKDWVQWVAKQEWTTFQDRAEPLAYQLFKGAVLNCIEGGQSFRYDAKSEEILVGIKRQGELPLEQLSSGQKSMVLMIGDIARRMVQLNEYLGAECLKLTPGVVLIDELDLHLHPIWQRTIPHSLKHTFPAIQFVCTSHSPQIIGELPGDEVQFLGAGKPEHPGQSFGMDSNWILNVLMGSDDKNLQVEAALETIKDLLMEKKIEDATVILHDLRSKVGNSYAIQRAASSIERFKILGK
jgi:predicted ATP-binding protein involved in virulence